MINLTLHEVLDLSIAKMLRHGVPEQEAEIAAPIFLFPSSATTRR